MLEAHLWRVSERACKVTIQDKLLSKRLKKLDSRVQNCQRCQMVIKRDKYLEDLKDRITVGSFRRLLVCTPWARSNG